jgi:hypothetical protein
MKVNRFWLVPALVVLAAASSCNKSDSGATGGGATGGGAAAAGALSEPDAYARDFVNGLAAGDVGRVWTAFPPKYQADIKSVIGAAAANLDPDVYNKAFAVAGKFVQLLKTKKDFIVNSPNFQRMLPIPKEPLVENWSAIVGTLESLTNSEIKTVDGLKKMDPGQFLSSTGGEIFRLGKAAGPQVDVALRKAKEAKVSVVKRDGNTATLKIEVEGETPDLLEVTQVEGKWLPSVVVIDWDKKIASIREDMSTLKLAPEVKTQAMIMIQVIDGALDGLTAATDQKSFDSQLALLQEMAGITGGPPPGAAPGGVSGTAVGGIPGAVSPTLPGGALPGPGVPPGLPGGVPLGTGASQPALPGTTPSLPALPK